MPIARAPVPDSLLASTAAFLKRYPPFDRMEHDALNYLASRLSISYHAAGKSILCPNHGKPEVLYIVRSGRVQLTPSHGGLEHTNATTLSTGECFSVGALLEKRATGSHYTAALDTFCYQLAAGDFAALLDRSSRLREFSTDYLASLLRESRRQVRAARAHAADEEQMMNRPLGAVIQRAPVSCPPHCSIAEVLRTMHEARIGSMVVVDMHAHRNFHAPRCFGSRGVAANAARTIHRIRDVSCAPLSARACKRLPVRAAHCATGHPPRSGDR